MKCDDGLSSFHPWCGGWGGDINTHWLLAFVFRVKGYIKSLLLGPITLPQLLDPAAIIAMAKKKRHPRGLLLRPLKSRAFFIVVQPSLHLKERMLTLIWDVINDPAVYWFLFTGMFVTFNGLELKFHPFTSHPKASGSSADIFFHGATKFHTIKSRLLSRTPVCKKKQHSISLYCSRGVIQASGRCGSRNSEINIVFLAQISTGVSTIGAVFMWAPARRGSCGSM